MNRLYYGDNLEVLRKYISDESVDLIYLDPPFNSKADYNILYKEQNGKQSASQIQAFSDFWHWDLEAQKTFEYLTEESGVKADLKRLIVALHDFLGNNDMCAYLVMMAARLIELRRVLKEVGSIYLHCDFTASHYLKIVMDSIFGKENFRNEIIWKRTSAHNDPQRYGKIHDVILFYSKSENIKFNVQYQQYDDNYVESHYGSVDNKGRNYTLSSLVNPHPGGYIYEYKGYKAPEFGWRMPLETMIKWDNEGVIYFPDDKNKRPRRIRYLDEMPGVPVQDMWNDISPINSQSNERLGYPTQKPLALLERIISASSNSGDVVLDPFCGCGTTLDAAEKLHRQWVGIDITHLAINVIKRRLRERYPDVKFEVIGEPKDMEGAKELARVDRYQFQWWACSLIEATPYQDKKKGADTGIDCVLYNPVKGTNRTYYGIVQVKSGNVNSGQVRDFKGTMEREKADYGIFLTLEDPTEPMNKEAVVAGHIKTEWNASIPKVQVLTIKELLEGKQPEFPFPPDNYNTAARGKRASKTAEQKTLPE